MIDREDLDLRILSLETKLSEQTRINANNFTMIEQALNTIAKQQGKIVQLTSKMENLSKAGILIAEEIERIYERQEGIIEELYRR